MALKTMARQGMRARLGRCVPIRIITIILMFSLALMASTPIADGADFEIPLKELKSPAAKGYEIPLSELTRGERKTPKRPGSRRRKEKKKADHLEEETPGQASAPSTGDVTPPPSARETDKPATPAAQSLQQPVLQGKAQKTNDGTAGKSATAAVQIAIIHEPYSYVVAGKPTIVDAVIISPPDALTSVRCRFRAAETGGYAHVAMQKIPGTTYSYTATLPSLVQGSNPLRYRIIATDALNKETRSQEFVTPVRATSVVPGWQVETAQGTIKVWLEDPPSPLVGFSGITVEDTVKP